MWDYSQDPALARGYDAALAETPLLRFDLDFAREHLGPPGRLVDLGCGTGRLAIEAARAGWRVTGIDLSAEMLRVTGEKAARDGLHLDRVRANLVELEFLAGGAFDAAACLFGTLGMLQGDAARGTFLGHVRRLLRPGGTFVLHVHNRLFHLGTRFGRRLLMGNWWHALRGRQAKGDFVMPPHQGIGPLTMHLFTRGEIQRLLRSAGFRLVEVRPIGVEGSLKARWWLPGLRAYGFLIAARV